MCEQEIERTAYRCGAVGAMMRGIPVAGGQYAGDPFGWLHPFAILTGIGHAPLAMLVGARRQCDGLPFAMTGLFFLAAFLSLRVTFWPYMIPYSVTVASAAAPEASLRFLFCGGIVVLPIIAVYTIGVYLIFRGKVRTGLG
jgi:cytochrome d ubiquinol oxidase subunit II